VVVSDLRYSARSLVEAERERRRPRPEPVRRRVDVYSYARSAVRDRSLSRMAAHEERRARQRLRVRLGVARRSADRPGRSGPVLRGDFGNSTDIGPVRHRHSAVWHF
jgi:hypothetical protein